MGISQFIKDKAMELGFSACGIAEVAKAGSEEAYFDQWMIRFVFFPIHPKPAFQAQ